MIDIGQDQVWSCLLIWANREVDMNHMLRATDLKQTVVRLMNTGLDPPVESMIQVRVTVKRTPLSQITARANDRVQYSHHMSAKSHQSYHKQWRNPKLTT